MTLQFRDRRGRGRETARSILASSGTEAEALESIEGSEWSRPARFLGGPPTLRAERRLGGPADQQELASYLDIVREVMNTQGESHEVLGGVEWKWDDRLAKATVRISPDGDASKVVVSVVAGAHQAPDLSDRPSLGGGL